MEKTRDFVNQYATISLMLMLGVVILFSFSCGPVDEDDIDQLLQQRKSPMQHHPQPLKLMPKFPLMNLSD